MKKKICYFIVIVLMVFIATGCNNGETTRGIRHAGFTLSGSEFNCTEFMPIDEEDTNYTKIWYLGASKIITDTGIIYEMALDGEFSTGESCKKADFTKRVVGIFDDKIIKADDGKFYYLVSNGNAAAYSQVTTEDNSYQVYQILFEDPDVTKVITVDQNSGIYYLLKRDGNVYKYIVTRPSYNEPYILRSSEIIYSKGTYGGAILDFNYTNSLGTNYIRTNSSLYRTIASNRDECSKYADIQCQYQMQRDDDLYQYMNQIIAYNGSTIITTYGSVFTI